ncbi:lipopolysaccharide kinase InaA family protein [Flavivirga abyssicola]|uniref:lipopolysaccharide kinase InaA family protein n=1 Tax=Flavivirga abyssicola TaxID=3063533 RepID=UPI0026DEDE2C|nr:lipopolysaccharide kinase InaA family protein [Flavivirga sp. MEBiC07777]WVK12362.1 lipopolysaccharide kinase InaA family protein [Flavivirga sp. MEBiC07777]
MQKRFVIHHKYSSLSDKVKDTILKFEGYKDVLGAAERNVIKIVPIDGKKYTIKSFRIPNLFNKIVYRFFRKSKAERSYLYANKLIEFGINTPYPVAYEIQTTPFLFKKSYYVSELIDCDLTYRELTTDFSIPDHEEILREFTRFTYKLHENGVNFLDHSPGNTLIERKEKGYEFYLVDLNRMEFGTMDFNERIKNFSKLTIHRSMIEIMSNEYAKCSGYEEEKVFNLMWQYTREFQHAYYRKIRIKKRLFFWKEKYKNKVSDSPI